MNASVRTKRAPWRDSLERIIFGVDTRAGRLFDVVLMAVILSSTFVVSLESVPSLRESWGGELRAAEWAFTVLFTVEYALRLATVRRPVRYATSLYGIVDLLAVVPTYASFFFAGAQSLTVVRALRLLRVFRVLKLGHYLAEARVLAVALRRSRPKITVFLFAVVTVVLVVGSLMYLIEGSESGFTSIPVSMYWAVVTMTTVGYVDIAPKTVLGRLLASVLMILGYGVIAVPTGIVSVELADAARRARHQRQCPGCAAGEHDQDARYCKYCGEALGAEAYGEMT
jgi:voltage-gated potassium channel